MKDILILLPETLSTLFAERYTEEGYGSEDPCVVIGPDDCKTYEEFLTKNRYLINMVKCTKAFVRGVFIVECASNDKDEATIEYKLPDKEDKDDEYEHANPDDFRKFVAKRTESREIVIFDLGEFSAKNIKQDICIGFDRNIYSQELYGVLNIFLIWAILFLMTIHFSICMDFWV